MKINKTETLKYLREILSGIDPLKEFSTTRGNEDFHRWKKRVEVILKNIYGSQSNELNEFQKISFNATSLPAGQMNKANEIIKRNYLGGLTEANSYLIGLIEEYEEFGDGKIETKLKKENNHPLLEWISWGAVILGTLIALIGGEKAISNKTETHSSKPSIVGSGNVQVSGDHIGPVIVNPPVLSNTQSGKEQQINHEIRNQIGNLLEQGQILITGFVPEADPVKMREKEKRWENRVEKLFKKYPSKFDATDLANFHVKGTEDHVAPHGIGGDLYFGWADTSASVEALRKISDRFQ